ncbi:MAG: metal-dependent hydrolase [Ignavibacteriaceae bacterium]
MFIGHYGAGFAGKKIDNKPSLGTMFFAAQFLDLLWPVFILLGIENVKIVPGLMAANPLDFTYYPYTHSLFFTIIWGILFGAVYFLVRKNLKGSFLLGSLVLSHWILDLIVHRPDLPVLPWSDLKVGFGLWNSVPVSFVLEVLIFSLGAFFYLSSTKAKNKTGNFALWGLIIFLLVIFIANIFSSPPPSVEAIGIAGLSQWLIVAWAYWIDRNRYNISEQKEIKDNYQTEPV